MNKTAKKVVATILTTVMTVGAATVVSADDLSITLSHQPYSHALPSYIGEEEGIFEENGLNTEILWFSSGNTQNEALGANEWDAGACGTPPAIAAGIAYNAKIVGFSVDDTEIKIKWLSRQLRSIALHQICRLRSRLPQQVLRLWKRLLTVE